MLVRGPNVTPGARVPAVAGIVDLTAMFVELAGGDAAKSMFLDGVSMVPQMHTAPTPPRVDMQVEYWTMTGYSWCKDGITLGAPIVSQGMGTQSRCRTSRSEPITCFE